MKYLGCLLTLFLNLWLCTISYAQPLELIFWHAMAGSLGEEVQHLADDFNHSQSDVVIKPVYKGDYVETLTSFAGAFRANKAPAIVQIFEAGSATMLAPQGVIKPLDELMQEQGIALPKQDFIPSVRDFYSRKGILMAMPFNLSTPVLYYNRDLLEKIGYKQFNIPQTWDEMELLAKRLKDAGLDCTYTSAYPGWIVVESYLAIHGLPLIQDKPLRAAFNSTHLVNHLARLNRWNKAHYFRYGGRLDEATLLFTSSVCPLFSQSSGAYNSLSALVPFHLGVALMPLDKQASTKRYANLAGGAALWVVAGQTQQNYKGIAQFFAYLAKPEVQKKWHAHTGYLPLGMRGIYADLVRTSTHPVLRLAQKDLANNSVNKTAGPQSQIRRINNEILEAMFAGLMGPDEALWVATKRVNHALWRFTKNTGG